MPVLHVIRYRFPAAVLALLALVGATQQFTGSAAAQSGNRVDVLISFASMPGPGDAALVRAAGGLVRHTYRIVPGLAASLPATAVAALERNPRIAAIEPDGQIQAYQFGTEYELAWGVGRIGSEGVHQAGLLGSGVRVAVFDSGVEYTHYELQHAFSGGYDFVNGDGDPIDDNGHGTHVAGTIVADLDGNWVVGVAPMAQLYAVKVLSGAGSGNWSDVVAGLDWAVTNGIQVTNHSYGDSADPGTLVEQAFANAAAAGMVHVAAAGNEGNCRGTGNSVGYPARFDSVIAVSASNQTDGHPCFSSSGPSVELTAPGEFIVSSYIGGDVGYLSGTSMASPHVAGAAALLFHAGIVDPIQVRNLLASTAEDLGANGRDKIFGFGLVDVAAAVAAAGPTPPAVNVALSTDQAQYDSSATEATLTAVVTDELGSPIEDIGFVNFEARLDGVVVPVSFLESATEPGTYAGTLDISGAGDGPHSVAVTVTFGAVGSDIAAFQIGSPPQAGVATVPSITYSGRGGPDGYKTLYITVPVVDDEGAPVAGATVGIIVWVNGIPWAYGEAATDASGQIIFQGQNTPSGSYYTEIVGVIAPGLEWDGVTPPNGLVK